MTHPDQQASLRVRLDKWLWAARFFKTRALAKAAIEGGKVHYDGQRCKVSKNAELGARLSIRQGFDLKEVEIKGLSDQRRGAPDAQKLYEETPESIKQRMDAAEQRKILKTSLPGASHKPNKKERRDMRRFEHQHGWND